MSRHPAAIEWSLGDTGFDYPDYSRDHEWLFEGGVRVPASSAPAYRGAPERVDPEEAFVAAVASCHMLTFLAICSRKGLVVEHYRDEAVGYLEKNRQGRLAITHVDLAPQARFRGAAPDSSELAQLHGQAHEQCFIANSIRASVTVNGVK